MIELSHHYYVCINTTVPTVGWSPHLTILNDKLVFKAAVTLSRDCLFPKQYSIFFLKSHMVMANDFNNRNLSPTLGP